LLVRATYVYGVVLHAHPVRGESHNQRNTTGEVATVLCNVLSYTFVEQSSFNSLDTCEDKWFNKLNAQINIQGMILPCVK